MSETEERTGLEPRPFVPAGGAVEEEEPPGKQPRRHPLWRHVPDHLWDDWRWQSQNAIRSVRQLRGLLSFTPEELEAIGSLETEYKTAIPPYYFSLIDPDNPHDPIRIQSVPSPLEQDNPSGYELEDPLEEDKDSPVPGLTHRYPDRALLVTTHVCTMYCRFCTRKRATMVRGGWDAVSRNDERMIEYVRDHPEIRDVIVSGGDPLIGAGHFRTSVWKGLEIMEGLRGHLSGLGIPTYVVDSPHGGGKIPLMPNYLVSASDDAVVLRNYEGMLVRYQAEDKPNTVQSTKTRGVSSLLQGTKSALIPENTERMNRRALHLLSHEDQLKATS